MIGKTLGHYQITSQLGKGGMGEVYQAKDQKLGRDVAIKVLPEEFARDADRVARFQREAKVLASLNHPSIAAIYGLEESGGTNFLVLELIEGETLADRIKNGPIPVEEALKLTLQIAEALEAAHEKGVIHRDLKPANIKVTPDGKAKVLDFGLAKAFTGEQAELNLSNSPTLSNAATQQGVILGTAAYMSPEQARGKSVDKKADIWAFGCVLYEMLTGQAAFQGEDVSEILASVIKGDVELLPDDVPARVREVISRSLQKDVRKRYQDIGDVRIELEQILADPQGLATHAVAAAERGPRMRQLIPWVVVTAVITAIIGTVAGWTIRQTEPRHVMRFSDILPENQKLPLDTSALRKIAFSRAIAISHDGSRLAYSTGGGICLRSMDQADAKIIPGTEGEVTSPFFSPDGQWIGFWSAGDQKLKKVSINGGSPVTLCDVENANNVTWNSDNSIVFDGQGILMRVSAGGGNPVPLFDGKAEVFWAPQILPDGKNLLFTFASTDRRSEMKIAVQSLETGLRKVLFLGQGARYLPAGYIVYGQGRLLFAATFDADKAEVTGEPVPIIQDVFAGGATQYDVSDSGTLVYVPRIAAAPASQLRKSTLVWMDRNGKEQPIPVPANDYRTAKISPDGTRIALSVRTGDKLDIWIWNLVHETMTRSTFDEISGAPLWTLDDKRIAFTSGRDNIYWKAADGTGKEEKLGSGVGFNISPESWSHDGKTLLLMMNMGGGQYDIVALPIEGGQKWRPLLKEKYLETRPRISPDGQWMAYVSDESGRDEIYVRPFPAVDSGKWQVSTNGGNYPLWSPDGHELFYAGGNGQMAVPIKTAPNFSFETAKILFRRENYTGGDITPDGKRFLLIKPVSDTTSAAAPSAAENYYRRINIVLNWTEEMKQRGPVK
jgi:eukaryotic-like serine/threonine-protein kinase